MAIAACPRYLRRQPDGKENHEFYLSAPPGHRFSIYFPVWGENAEARNVDWRISDRAPKLKRGRDGALQQGGWEDLNNKHFASTVSACSTPAQNEERPRARAPAKDDGLAAWRPLAEALVHRQSRLASALSAQDRLLTLDAKSTAPFTTGLGNEHPLENGFAFLNPYGLPYLAGSGVKGVLRQAARELASGDWGDSRGWDDGAVTHLFGRASENGGIQHQRGALMFWDVLPQIEGDSLQVDVMTPHQSHYYQQRREVRSGDSTAPHDSGQPNPIHFLTVPPGSRFTFHVQCDLPFLRRLGSPLAEAERWQPLLQAAFEHAFAWLGFGAKTAVGYGAMAEDPKARRQREAERAAAEARATAAAERTRLDSLTPEDRAWAVAESAVDEFRSDLAKAKAAGPYNPGGPFNQKRQAFMKTALAWTEPRSRAAAAEALADSATKAWGRPSNKDRWNELQAAISQLKGPA